MCRTHHLDEAARFCLVVGNPLLVRMKVTERLLDISTVRRLAGPVVIGYLPTRYRLYSTATIRFTIHGLQQVVKQPASMHDRYEVEASIQSC